MKMILKLFGFVVFLVVVVFVLVQDIGIEVGIVYIVEINCDWQVCCMMVSEGIELCQMYQLILDVNGNLVVEILVFLLFVGNEVVVGVIFVVLLGILLFEGVGIMVDDGSLCVYVFEYCNFDGCVVCMGFIQVELDQFKVGNVVKICLILVFLQELIILLMLLFGFIVSFVKVIVLEN